MASRPVALVEYASPDLIPASLKAVSFVDGVVPDGVQLIDPTWVAAPSLAPAGLVCYGAVRYASYDLVPVAGTRRRLFGGLASFSNLAAPVPVQGAELLVNGDMETGSPPTNWGGVNLGVISAVVDTRTGGLGSKSLNVALGTNVFAAYAAQPSGTIGQWLQEATWLRVVDATDVSFYQPGFLRPRNGPAVTTTAWQQVVATDRQAIALAQSRVYVTGAQGVQVRADDWSLKPLVLSSLVSVRQSTTQYGTAQADVTLVQDTQAGVVLNLDAPDAPQNFVLGYISNAVAYLAKCVAGTYTTMINQAITYQANATVMLKRLNGTNTYQLWYAGVQIGTDQTIADAGIVGNRYHGVFSTYGPNTLANNRFLAASPQVDESVVYLGGSITASSTDTSWRPRLSLSLVNTYPNLNFVSQYNAGWGGTGSWYGLVRLQADVLAHAPTLVMIDFVVNDGGTATTNRTAEALLRRIRAGAPSAKLLALFFLQVADRNVDANVNTNLNETVKQTWILLCQRYGVAYVDVAARYAELVNAGTYHLNELLGDNVHPGPIGHGVAYDLLRAQVTESWLRGPTQWTGSLGDYAYLYDDGSYETTPLIVNGTSRDSVTGVWSTVSTAIESSAAGATATFSGTCQSFGLDSPIGAGAGVVSWQVDGGGWTNRDLSVDGQTDQMLWSGSRAAHTVVFKVVSGTVRINRFLAV